MYFGCQSSVEFVNSVVYLTNLLSSEYIHAVALRLLLLNVQKTSVTAVLGVVPHGYK